ncbi:MAG TPA: hypothetical protein V6D07_18985 [Trichocoleus sp.]
MIKYSFEFNGNNATVKLDVDSSEKKGEPEIGGSQRVAESIEFALKYKRVDLDAHIIPEGPLYPWQLDCILKTWNSLKIYKEEILEGKDLIVYPSRDLPKGAIS